MNKPILVKRSILSGAQQLEALSLNGVKPLDLAERKAADCQAGGDNAGMKFWRSVWIHLMLKEYAPGPIQIVEDEQASERPPTPPRVLSENANIVMT